MTSPANNSRSTSARRRPAASRLAVALVGGVALGGTLTLRAQGADDRARLQALDGYIERAMAANVAPGIAVAVVRGSDIVYAKGFGLADRERNRPVTPDTQFYVASVSKSFTALAASLLDARGELALAKTLREALPGAQFHSGVDPDAITLRDLLTHTHGLKPMGAIDFRAAFSGEFTNDQQLALLRFHGPAAKGRAYAYSNLGYNIYGMALDTRFDQGWQAVLQREVFDALGMRHTTADVSKGDPLRMAQPYEFGSDGPERVAYAKQDANMQAAGGHLSTAHDLARYLIAHVTGGRIDDRQVLPEKAVRETHRKQAEQNRRTPLAHVHGWGLGWDLATYDGDEVLRRYGGFQGFHAQISFLPAQSVGVVVLANGGAASVGVADLTAAFAYDLLLNKPAANQTSEARWTAYASQIGAARKAKADKEAARSASRQTPLLPLSAYAGTYESEVLGRMVVTVEPDGLRATMGVASSSVEVQEAARHQFQIELTGSTEGLTFDVPAEAGKPVAVRFLNETFARLR